MKRLTAIAVFSLVAGEVTAQETRYLFDLTEKRTYAAYYKPVGKLTGLFGSGVSAEMGMIAATDFQGRPLVGYALQSTWKIADQASLFFGPSLTFATDDKPRVALLAGISFKF